MSSQLPPMPDLIHDEWDKYSLEDLREEMANTRRFVASLFLQVKEWTTRLNDLQETSQQKVSSFASDDARYIELSNTVAALETARTELSNKTNELDEGLKNSNNVLLSRLNELDENITLIMDFLGMSDDGEGDNQQ